MDNYKIEKMKDIVRQINTLFEQRGIYIAGGYIHHNYASPLQDLYTNETFALYDYIVSRDLQFKNETEYLALVAKYNRLQNFI